jgi:uncharacterized protein YbjT (DUF2867 family)
VQRKVALIVGSSGLVGQLLLKRLLADKNYKKVIILVRTPLALSHERLEQHQVNFQQLDAIEEHVDHVFCTLGTTIKKAGSKQAFKKVDYDYPLTIAQHYQANGAKLFAIVTAMGANKTSSIFYNKIKGEVEEDLKAMSFQYLGLFRPSMLAGDRNEFRFAEQLGSLFMRALAFVIPANYQLIQADNVAKAMHAYAQLPALGVSVIQSAQMQNQ